MKNNFRLITIIILLLALIFTFTGCNRNEDDNSHEKGEVEKKSEDKKVDENKQKKNITVNIAGLKGPSSMGMIKLFEDKPDLGENIKSEYIIESAPDVLVGKVINGEVDIAALPSNVAAVLYTKTKGEYLAASVNTLSVLYLLSKSKDDIISIEDLKGKKVYISGKGATPDYAFRYLLKKNSLDPDKDIDLVFETEHSTVAAALIGGDAQYAVLPQPFVTTTLMKDKDIKIAVDFQKEWEAIEGDNSTLAMTTLVVKKDFVQNNKESLKVFMKEYEKSVNWVNKNHKEAGELIEKHGVLPKAKIAELAIPKCNIVYIDGEVAQKLLNGFYNVLYDFNPKSVGGKIPDEGFYITN